MEENKTDIDYHKELNNLAYDIRGCYNEQFKERDEYSVRDCLRTIEDNEPLQIVEYYGIKFIVGACRSREDNFVGGDENQYLMGRPREVSVTIGAELNSDGTVKKGAGAKSFVICAQSTEKTSFGGTSSWHLPAKTRIEVNFMERDPQKTTFKFPAFNVLESEAFACNRFSTSIEGKFFNVTDRKNILDAVKASPAYKKKSKKIFDAIQNCIVPNSFDDTYAKDNQPKHQEVCKTRKLSKFINKIKNVMERK